MNPAIEAAYDRVREAERRRDEIIKKTYLPGDSITYTHGEFFVDAKVISVSGDRVKVRGYSGNEYWVGAYRLL